MPRGCSGGDLQIYTHNRKITESFALRVLSRGSTSGRCRGVPHPGLIYPPADLPRDSSTAVAGFPPKDSSTHQQICPATLPPPTTLHEKKFWKALLYVQPVRYYSSGC